MKSKRGQGLPMNTIVIAAIVLVVLVVIVLIFTGSMGQFTGKLKDCNQNGGICQENKCSTNQVEIKRTNCEDTKDPELPYCCITLEE